MSGAEADAIEVEVEDPSWTRALPAAEGLARQAAEAAAAAPGGALTILLASDAVVRDLNRRFRGVDAPTNVLSFPSAATSGGQLGDIALAFGVCEREARSQEKPLGDHLRHLVVHGVLHLLGHDHQSDAEGDAMEALERDILSGLGIGDPYALQSPGQAEADHVQPHA